MILVFDTETTGLPLFKSRSNDPEQPHLVQIALLSFADNGTEIDQFSAIVRPDGWVIPDEMTAIHGISHERAMDEGIPEEFAVQAFVMAQARAGMRAAHNESFDRRIMRIAMTRAGLQRDFIEHIENRQFFDTCAQSRKIVNLPPTAKMLAAGLKGPKSPNLGECIRHFFGEELDGAHDALIDARAAARIYFHLIATAEKIVA